MVGLSVYVFSGQNELEPVLFNEKTAVVVANRNGAQQNEHQSSYVEGNKDKTVKVYVTGAVFKPGVYDVPAKIRSLEVIKLAGGFSDTADVERVNVTRVVRDGMQINVPERKKNVKKQQVALGEEKPRVRSFKRPSRNVTANGLAVPQGMYVALVPVPEGTVVSLNNGTVKELSCLPGLHWELARRIVAYREEKGFTRVEDVLLVRGITPKIYEEMYKYLVL